MSSQVKKITLTVLMLALIFGWAYIVTDIHAPTTRGGVIRVSHTGDTTVRDLTGSIAQRAAEILQDREVQRTLQRIDQDRERYAQDDSIFLNREHHLPIQSDWSYYHEWTIVTPGSPDRGTRRIIVGSGGEVYFTDDHYASFVRIR